MERLLMATRNPGKLHEVRALLCGRFEVLGLTDVGVQEEIPETGRTLQENALLKARYLFRSQDHPVLADDTGLEVSALQGAPGVRSARFAGPEKNAVANMEKLLQMLHKEVDRSARFRTVLVYIDKDGREHLFEGVVKGHIIKEKRGEQGFGYDPVFVPKGEQRTFAEMDAVMKNQISHRGRAMARFSDHLVGSRA